MLYLNESDVDDWKFNQSFYLAVSENSPKIVRLNKNGRIIKDWIYYMDILVGEEWKIGIYLNMRIIFRNSL